MTTRPPPNPPTRTTVIDPYTLEGIMKKIIRRSLIVFALASGLVACGTQGQAATPEEPGPPLLQAAAASAETPLPEVIVYKDPGCECCSLWAKHVEAAGYPVTVTATQDMDTIKREAGVPAGKGSCHTAQVDGYFIEGHVPVQDIERLLVERPQARGLAAPGMPIGSPGMPGPAQPYTVELIHLDGSSTPFSQHGR